MVFNVILVLLLAFEFLNILFSYLNPFLLLSLFQHFSPLMASYFCSIVTKSSWIFEDSKPYFKVSSFSANSVLFFQSYFSPLIRIMFIFPVLHYLFKITMLKFFSNPYFPVLALSQSTKVIYHVFLSSSACVFPPVVQRE